MTSATAAKEEQKLSRELNRLESKLREVQQRSKVSSQAKPAELMPRVKRGFARLTLGIFEHWQITAERRENDGQHAPTSRLALTLLFISVLAFVVTVGVGGVVFFSKSNVVGLLCSPVWVVLGVLIAGNLVAASIPASHYQRQIDWARHTIIESEKIQRALAAIDIQQRQFAQDETNFKAQIRLLKHDLASLRLEAARFRKNLGSTNKLDATDVIVIGRGEESLYAYSFPSYMIGEVFEVKVGMTVRDPLERIGEQLGTSNAEKAKILLLVRTNNASQLETAVHRKLKRKSGAVGREWFITSPAEIERVVRKLTDRN